MYTVKDERIFTETATQVKSDCIFTQIAEMFWKKSWKTAPWSLNLHSAISGDVHSLFLGPICAEVFKNKQQETLHQQQVKQVTTLP